MAAQTAGAHSKGSAGPRAMPWAVGAERGDGTARGAVRHHPCWPRVRYPFVWSLSRNSWSNSSPGRDVPLRSR